MESQPKVSILMPVHNGGGYLRAAVESLLGQTFADFELLVIDDASTDTTGAVLAGFADPRLVVVRNAANQGLTRCLNHALQLARGQYIARMDADDISLPDRLAQQVRFLDVHPDIGVVGSAVRHIDGPGRLGPVVGPLARSHETIRWSLCFRSPLAHPAVMMRREAPALVGGYDPGFVTAQDRDLWRRLSAVTRLANLPEVLLYLRIHEANISVVRRMEQSRDAARASQPLIEDVLGEAVPFDLCLGLERGEFADAQQARRAARLIYRLYRAFTGQSTLTKEEHAFIRRDAGAQMVRVLKRWRTDPRIWPALVTAVRLSPGPLGRRLARKGLRAVGRPFRRGAA